MRQGVSNSAMPTYRPCSADHLHLLAQNLVYYLEQVGVPAVLGLLQVKFPRRNTDQLAKALEGSQKVLWIRHTRRTRWARLGQLLGFARATSDCVVSATIWDVAVRLCWLLFLDSHHASACRVTTQLHASFAQLASVT